MNPYLKLLRMDHWIKNLFMLPGVAIAITFNSFSTSQLFNTEKTFSVIIAFLSLCIASSANYTINEWLDRDLDQLHPHKKHRVASQYSFSGYKVWGLYIFLVIVVLITFLVQRWPVNLYITSLLIMGIFYNVEPFRLKDHHYADVIAESINNPIRFAIGWHAVSPDLPVPASAFLAFWGGGIFLMSLKRYSEMVIVNDPLLLGQYRKSFRKWTPNKLIIFAFTGALIAMTFMGIMLVRYRLEYVLVVPSLILMFIEYLKMSLRMDLASIAPEKLMKKTSLQLLVLLVFFNFLVFSFIDVPILETLVKQKNE
jgi:4-hydroxybenzoate polyprenyltransferase